MHIFVIYPWSFELCVLHTNFATHVSICTFDVYNTTFVVSHHTYKTFHYHDVYTLCTHIRNFGGAFWPGCIFGANTLV